VTRAYYNEIDPHAAQWLRNLIDAGMIAFGDVDERDIRDIRPAELAPYTQCHFFAGIGVWSYALRLAGWPDDRPVWTGSPPCQPFSAAGRREGVADERHLWPHWHYLISECRPHVVFGEQVASKDGLGWLDLVQSDMEGTHYACGAVDLCAAGVGAPHIRQRQFFFFRDRWKPLGMGDSSGPRLEGQRGHGTYALGRQEPDRSVAEAGAVGELADGKIIRREEECPLTGRLGSGDREERGATGHHHGGAVGALGHNRGFGCDAGVAGNTGSEEGSGREHGLVSDRSCSFSSQSERPCPTNGFWRDADWLFCRDGKWRPVESGTFPLVDGIAFRLDSGSPFAGKSRAKLLAGAGNAIVSEAAAHVIASYLEAEAAEIAALDAGRSELDLIGDLL
jgi:DNA (cytosine-5)-methyltransferase 1